MNFREQFKVIYMDNPSDSAEHGKDFSAIYICFFLKKENHG